MRVLVTGGAGFIGANLVRQLESDPDIERITVLDDLSTGSLANLVDCSSRVHFVEGSVLDDRALAGACEGVDAIVHLAARPSVARSIEDPMAAHAANATGTLQVLEAARRCGGTQVILASSSSVYGANPTLPKSEDLRPVPLSPYAVSKLAAETYALAYEHCFGLPVLAFRFFNVFGPLQPADHAYAAAIPSFLDAALSGRPILIHGDGHQTRDFTYVGSVVSVIADALRRGIDSPEPVNLAFGTRRSLLDVVSSIRKLVGEPLVIEHTAPRVGDVRDSQADSERLVRMFPSVAPVGFEQGLAETISWFRESTAAPTVPSRR
jgi:UDP-glucose 4-epimerase